MILFRPATISAFIAYGPFNAQVVGILCIFVSKVTSIPLVFPKRH